jgi:hypothetical protein
MGIFRTELEGVMRGVLEVLRAVLKGVRRGELNVRATAVA